MSSPVDPQRQAADFAAHQEYALSQLAAAAAHSPPLRRGQPVPITISPGEAFRFGFWAALGSFGASLLIGLVIGFIFGFIHGLGLW